MSEITWYIHHEGGGWCSGITPQESAGEPMDPCSFRATMFLGSTRNDTATKVIDGGYFSNDPRVNPMMYSWNHKNLCIADHV